MAGRGGGPSGPPPCANTTGLTLALTSLHPHPPPLLAKGVGACCCGHCLAQAGGRGARRRGGGHKSCNAGSRQMPALHHHLLSESLSQTTILSFMPAVNAPLKSRPTQQRQGRGGHQQKQLRGAPIQCTRLAYCQGGRAWPCVAVTAAGCSARAGDHSASLFVRGLQPVQHELHRRRRGAEAEGQQGGLRHVFGLDHQAWLHPAVPRALLHPGRWIAEQRPRGTFRAGRQHGRPHACPRRRPCIAHANACLALFAPRGPTCS